MGLLAGGVGPEASTLLAMLLYCHFPNSFTLTLPDKPLLGPADVCCGCREGMWSPALWV